MSLPAYDLRQTVGPETEPLTVSQAKDHLELLATSDEHDEKLKRLITAARQKFERETGYIVCPSTHVLAIHEFPSCGILKVPVEPLRSVTSITYYDSDNAQQTLASSVYYVHTGPRIIELATNQTWPSITSRSYGIEITMACGYTSIDNIPSLWKEAMLLIVGGLFEDRGDKARYASMTTAYEKMRIANAMRRTYP